MPAKTPFASDQIDAPAACATLSATRPFHFVHTAGGVMRTGNVSEYMLVLALWLVYKLIRLFIHLNQTTTVLREAGWPRRNGLQPLRSSTKLKCGPMPNVLAALGIYRWCPQLKIIKSEFPFLVPCRKVWLTPTVPVPCSNAAKTGKRKTWTQSKYGTWQNTIRGQEPPKMYI